MPTTWHRFTPSVAVFSFETKKVEFLVVEEEKAIKQSIGHHTQTRDTAKCWNFKIMFFCLFRCLQLQSRRLKSHSQHKSRFFLLSFVYTTSSIIGSHLLALILAHTEHEIKKVKIKIKFHVKHKRRRKCFLF